VSNIVLDGGIGLHHVKRFIVKLEDVVGIYL
jgi:hypothetical protein